MKKIIATLLMGLIPALTMASGGGHQFPNDDADIDLGNEASLQRGAATFVNYCLSCHTANFMRYSRLANDLGLTEKQVMDNLMVSGGKIGDLMTVAMRRDDAETWFGNTPPDLSVIARAKGADYLYNYLRAFYVDESSPTGMNNSVKQVSMPHVLWNLQGLQKAVYEESEHGQKHIVGFEIVQPGELSTAEYNAEVRDLVNFLVYLGEPAKLQRYTIGLVIMIFLFVLLVFSYYLKKEFWKDVH
jgi:ubiquinol-cytochrome c reductase cytochrome c1 subunit